MDPAVVIWLAERAEHQELPDAEHMEGASEHRVERGTHQRPGLRRVAELRPGELVVATVQPDLTARAARTLRTQSDVLPKVSGMIMSRSMIFRDPEGHLVNVFSR